MKMTLSIHGDQTIHQVQENFRTFFSHLKPEFYHKPHPMGKGNMKQEQYLHNVPMKELMNAPFLEIEFDGHEPTGSFEAMLEAAYGLHVQIFRLQHNTWLQTTQSDGLTLIEQNEKGKLASEKPVADSPEDVDYQ